MHAHVPVPLLEPDAATAGLAGAVAELTAAVAGLPEAVAGLEPAIAGPAAAVAGLLGGRSGVAADVLGSHRRAGSLTPYWGLWFLQQGRQQVCNRAKG